MTPTFHVRPLKFDAPPPDPQRRCNAPMFRPANGPLDLRLATLQISAGIRTSFEIRHDAGSLDASALDLPSSSFDF